MAKRHVFDILDAMGGPVAYDRDEVRQVHQPVCPWCKLNIGVEKHLEPNFTVGELYFWLLDIQIEHMTTCSGRKATEMQVETHKRNTRGYRE